MSSEDINEPIELMDEAISGIEQHLRPFLDTPLSTLAAGMSELEAAKLNAILLFTMNSLFFMYLKLQGVDPATSSPQHPVIGELNRVRRYISRIKEVADASEIRMKRDAANSLAADEFIASRSANVSDVSSRPISLKRGMPEAGGIVDEGSGQKIADHHGVIKKQKKNK